MYIPALIDAVLSAPSTCHSSTTRQHLQQLVKDFVESEQYQALRRVALAIRSDRSRHLNSSRPNNTGLSLETIIHRYPYVYEYNFLTQDSTVEQRQTIQTIRQDAQEKYDLDLSRYMAYRQSMSYRNVAVLPAKNPTLLSSEQLNYALFHYKGKVDGKNTQRDLANCFLTYCRWTRSYHDFKGDLYDYLTMTLAPLFKGQRFGQKLSDRLQATLSHYDQRPPTTLLLNETCQSLLDFLVVESLQKPDHRNFIDLLGNLGTTLTISLLLKILLICGQAKPWLEQRFAILFNHYSDRPQNDVTWLVEAMETLNVAMSTNFSRIRGLGV
ncbi:MAG: hypothetical protein F6K16_41130 [Symploca sp. SIO2B6]|nr:hypothetical protein [Symploca sp. SIO2B6]